MNKALMLKHFPKWLDKNTNIQRYKHITVGRYWTAAMNSNSVVAYVDPTPQSYYLTTDGREIVDFTIDTIDLPPVTRLLENWDNEPAIHILLSTEDIKVWKKMFKSLYSINRNLITGIICSPDNPVTAYTTINLKQQYSSKFMLKKFNNPTRIRGVWTVKSLVRALELLDDIKAPTHWVIKRPNDLTPPLMYFVQPDDLYIALSSIRLQSVWDIKCFDDDED